MKYFLDTKFHEYHKKIRKGFKTISIPTIDLISIGIVSDDNREYYALCNECNLDDIWKDKWLKENVLKSIYFEYTEKRFRNAFNVEGFSKQTMKKLFNKNGFSKKEIYQQILKFVYPQEYFANVFEFGFNFNEKDVLDYIKKVKNKNLKFEYPEFYGYYSDYDWVIFAQLFGKMMDLPTEFPMYCKDLKQTKDELEEIISKDGEIHYVDSNGLGFATTGLGFFSWYPKQENEHNALDDAKWNKKLFYFLEELKIHYKIKEK